MIDILRDFFHMGRVEWVTCQVPVSHSMGGGVKSFGGLDEVVVGGRSFMEVIILGLMMG